LTATLDAIATALNGSAVAAVAKATYANVGGTKLGVTFDAFGSVGNGFTLAASAGTVSGATLTGGRDSDKLDILKNSVFQLETTAGLAETFVLPDGKEGQIATVYLKTKGSGANAAVTGSFVGGSTATLDAANDYLFLQFLGGSWRPLVNNSVTIS
jgi:hypothetical protein